MDKDYELNGIIYIFAIFRVSPLPSLENAGVCRLTTKLRQSQCLKKGLKLFCKVSFHHIEANKSKFIFNERFLQVSDRLNLSLVRISIITYLVVQNHLFKESLKFSAILPSENKIENRIYGRIC